MPDSHRPPPFVQLKWEVATGPFHSLPQPGRLQSLTLIAVLPSELERWDPPQLAAAAKLGTPPALLRSGAGWDQGSQQALLHLLCQCLTSWSDTPSLVPPSPKGDHGLHFHLPLPKRGAAGEVHHSWAPMRKEGRATVVHTSLDGVGGVLAGGGWVGA